MLASSWAPSRTPSSWKRGCSPQKNSLKQEIILLTNATLGRKSNNYFSFSYRWQSGDEKNINKNLPKDKQFLVTKGVPSEKRIADLKRFEEENEGELEREVEDGWVETKNPQKKRKDNQ